jgi:hypothetical protein
MGEASDAQGASTSASSPASSPGVFILLSSSPGIASTIVPRESIASRGAAVYKDEEDVVDKDLPESKPWV